MQENLTQGNHAPMSEKTDKKWCTIKSFLGILKEKLLFPFRQDLIYFLLLWIVIALPNCWLQLSLGNVVYTLYLLMLYYIIAYIVTVILNLNKYIAMSIRPLVLVLTTVLSLLNIYCYSIYDCWLSNNFIQIIAGTNPNEAKEYFETFVTWQQTAIFSITVGIVIVVSILLAKRKCRKYGNVWIVPVGVLVLSFIGVCHNLGMVEDVFSEKNHWDFTFEEVIDLRNHPTHPQIEEMDSIHPTHIVLVVGESFSSNHSSLYGYKKRTNPLLGKKAEEEHLIVFKNVTSPYTNTTAAFKYLLNTNLVGHEDGKQWYEHTNLIEVMNAIGYHTAWISNQSEKGLYDNLPSGHSKLCKETFFLENDNNVSQYDGSLINKASFNKEKVCVFYHLMGQHEDFQRRYPKEYDQFKPKDYADYPEHQREILAAYDNATLYNDFVVSSIMDLYQDKDAVVFYFSDHALDVFDTDPNYFGHAKMTQVSQVQGKKIPFMIYASPVFQKCHAEKVEMMRNAVNHPFCVDKFIYAVMDIAGYRFADNDDVKKYSVFSLMQ